eukprot:366513-Chlamydomonas_euryale.AAC.6
MARTVQSSMSDLRVATTDEHIAQRMSSSASTLKTLVDIPHEGHAMPVPSPSPPHTHTIRTAGRG